MPFVARACGFSWHPFRQYAINNNSANIQSFAVINQNKSSLERRRAADHGARGRSRTHYAVLILGLLICGWGIWSSGRAGLSAIVTSYASATNQLESVDNAVRLNPSNSDAHYLLASLLSDKELRTEAVRAYEQAATLRPRDYVLWLELGRARDQAGNVKGALAAFAESARLAPFYAQPHWQLGNALLRSGRQDESLAELRRAAASDPKLLPQLNRAIYGTYPMGSVFKIVDSLVALENGHDPEQIFHSEGHYQLGRKSKPIGDTAGPGEFNFRRAFLKSSNPYFIDVGLKFGPEKLIEMGHRFHFGEHTGVLTNQEHRGYFPPVGPARKRDLSRWQDGDTANLAIGQGEIAITPIQVACMTAAVANRGTLLYPRLVTRIAPQERSADNPGEDFPGGIVRDHITITERTWNILHEAMLADVEDPEGTGRQSFVAGLRVCGKTGTAQLKTSAGVNHIVWFASFAPYESPRYAVVIMAETEHAGSGGGTCAPVAREIYKALQRQEQLGRLNFTSNN